MAQQHTCKRRVPPHLDECNIVPPQLTVDVILRVRDDFLYRYSRGAFGAVPAASLDEDAVSAFGGSVVFCQADVDSVGETVAF